jgi:hypothetical protein
MSHDAHTAYIQYVTLFRKICLYFSAPWGAYWLNTPLVRFLLRSLVSSVSIVAGLQVGRSRNQNSWQRHKETLPFSTESRQALGSTLPPIQCVLRALSSGIKTTRREANHCYLSNVKIRNKLRYISIPLTASWCDVLFYLTGPFLVC